MSSPAKTITLQHWTKGSAPSPSRVLCISTLCALAPAGFQFTFGASGTLLGPHRATQDNSSTTVYQNPYVAQYPIGFIEEHSGCSTPTKPDENVAVRIYQTQVQPHIYQPSERHAEDGDGGFAIKRADTGKLSDYSVRCSMPSPRYGAE
ncbi:hypothetical protein BCR34DRAFT_604347 [Clohesyomyces aquaticus]|uniref:Uncharacterized protein n=1 Tax=Clohesyomyces aquaticus TaxID=1231657 RepID=A0A1Y1Z7E8_9PLEO|nr:hypothetical protein BCR34DRAFT_604347 [Clohesyomyces aquaticus]